MSVSDVTLLAMTDVDREDVDGWLARAERELTGVSFDPPVRLVDTSSAVLLHASFRPRGLEVDAQLTVYRDYGRVRLEITHAGSDDADSVRGYLVDSLELTAVS